jgi:hypothetical protein
VKAVVISNESVAMGQKQTSKARYFVGQSIEILRSASMNIARVIIPALLVSVSSPALAAGGFEQLPALHAIAISLGGALVFVLPSVGLGFFLQGLMRLRNALFLLLSGVLFVAGCTVQECGYARTLELVPKIAFFVSLFALLFFLVGFSE